MLAKDDTGCLVLEVTLVFAGGGVNVPRMRHCHPILVSAFGSQVACVERSVTRSSLAKLPGGPGGSRGHTLKPAYTSQSLNSSRFLIERRLTKQVFAGYTHGGCPQQQRGYLRSRPMTSSAFNETAFRGIVAPIGRLTGFRVPNLAVFGSMGDGRNVPRFWRSGECMQLVR